MSEVWSPKRVSKPRRLLYSKFVKAKKKQDQYMIYERHGQLGTCDQFRNNDTDTGERTCPSAKCPA